MALNTLGPLAAFGVGQQIGKSNSPITGIGLAIQNVVDDARKKGLLQAQSQFQTEGADILAKRKEGRAELDLLKPKTTRFIGATEAEDRIITGTRGEDVKGLSRKPFDLFDMIKGLQNLNLDGGQDDGGATFNSETELDAAITRGDVKIGDPVIVNGVAGTAQPL